MGLDVYMSKIENFERVKAKEKEYEKISEEIWNQLFEDKEWNDVSEEDKEKYHEELEKIKKAMNLSRYGTDLSRENITINSAKYPDHIFKIGYFRSSYNGSGFNSITGPAISMTLFDIFKSFDASYDEEVPDWTKSKENAQLMIDELKRIQKEIPYTTESLDQTNYKNTKQPKSKKEALNMFLEEIKSRENNFGCYSSAKGNFYLDKPIEVYALMNGKAEFAKENCIYYTTKMDYTWYIQAAEIVLETVDYVLAQDHPEWYVLSWSG